MTSVSDVGTPPTNPLSTKKKRKSKAGCLLKEIEEADIKTIKWTDPGINTAIALKKAIDHNMSRIEAITASMMQLMKKKDYSQLKNHLDQLVTSANGILKFFK